MSADDDGQLTGDMLAAAFEKLWAKDWSSMFPSAEPWFAEQIRGTAPEPAAGGFLVPPELRSEILATKLSASLLVPNELLGDAPPRKYPPPTRRQRFRQWRTDMRERLAYRAFKAIAGYEVPDGEDW